MVHSRPAVYDTGHDPSGNGKSAASKVARIYDSDHQQSVCSPLSLLWEFLLRVSEFDTKPCG